MNELRELESGIDKLKRDSQTKKMIISALEKEKQELLRRSDDLSERIHKTNEAYKESSNKIMGFVNSQVSQLKSDMAELSNSLKGLTGLEQRLEDQESRHEKTLTKLEKELALVEKSLSDVEGVKTELSKQRTFFQEAKLQLEKGLQSGISYLRKEMDMNRKEDAKLALEEFKEEIERISSLEKELNSYRRSQESRVDGLTDELSSLKSSLAELRILKEKSGTLEDVSRSLEKRVSELSNRQKTTSSVMTAELTKMLEKGLAGLKKELSEQRAEDSKAQLRQFRQELQRVANLEESLKEKEKRLDSLGSELSELHPLTDEVHALKEKVEENQHMNHSLADRTVSHTDFERALRTMSKRAEELENKLFVLDKRLSTDKSRLEKEILGILNEEKVLEATQDNVKKFFEGRFSDMERKVSSSIDALTTHMEEGAALVDRLRQKSQKMDILTRDVPKKLEDQSRNIMKLFDARAELASGLESLSGEARSLSDGLTSSLQRISSLEKGLSSVDRSKESRLDKLSEGLESYKQDMAKLSTTLSGSLERISGLEKTLSSADISMESEISQLSKDLASQRDELSKLSTRFSSALDEMASMEKSLSSFDKANRANQSRFSTTLSNFQQELKDQALLLKEFSESGKADMAGLRAEVSSSLKGMSKELDTRAREVAEQSLSELKEKTKDLASMKDLQSELKVLKSALSSVDKRGKDFAERFSQELRAAQKSMESRLSELSEEQAGRFRKDFDFITKNIDSIRELASDIKIFKTKVSDVERFARTKLSEHDFKQFRDYIETRLSDMDASSKKALDDLSGSLERFRSSVDSGKLSKEDFSKQMELIETRIQDLGVMSKSSNDELAKDLASFKKLMAERLNEVKGSQLREFKDELKRVSQLEQSTDATARTHEKRIDQLSQGLSSLEPMPAEISVLREKLDSLEEQAGAMVPARDFSQKVREINSSLEQLQSGLLGLDKRLHKQATNLEASVQEAMSEEKLLKRSQEGMAKLIDSRIADVEKRLSSGIEDIAKDLLEKSGVVSHVRDKISELSRFSKQATENQANLDSLKERVTGLELASKDTSQKASEIDGMLKRLVRLESISKEVLENSDLIKDLGEGYQDIKSLMKTLPATVEKHSDSINKILESKEFLTENVSGMKSDISNLSKELSSAHKRLSSIEEGFSAKGETRESRLDELSSALEAMDTKLESSRKEIKDFREHILQHMNDVVNSYEKRFGEFAKDLSARHAGKSEKDLTELVQLKDKVAELETLTKGLSKSSVPEQEFVETIRSISKRIDNIEEMFSDVDKKTTVHEAQLDAAVQKALSEDRLLKSSQKHIQELLDSRIGGLEEKLSGEISDQSARLESSLEDISKLRDSVNELKGLEKQLDSELVSKAGEGMASLSKAKETLERRLEGLSGELKSMNDKFIDEKARVVNLENRLKSSLDKHQATIREMFSKQRASIDEEISDETAKALKEAEVGELKRKQEFDNLLKRFQELHIKTQQNLDAVSDQRKSFLQLERSLRDRVDNATASAVSKVQSEQARLKKRLDDSEGLIMKLNNMISDLQVRLEKKKDVEIDIDDAVSSLKEDLVERMKANEDMFDSEMDAFRRKLDSISNSMNSTSELLDLKSKFQDLYNKTQDSLDSISDHKDKFREVQSKISENIKSGKIKVKPKVMEDVGRLSKRLEESEKMISNLNSVISDLQLKLDSKTDMKMGLDKALTDLRTEVDSRMKTMDKMLNEFNAWKSVHKGEIDRLPATERKQLESITRSVEDLANRLQSSQKEMKSFKEYVVEYMNNLVNTYEGRMKSIKKDISGKSESV